MPDLQTQISTISEEALNALFDDTPITNLNESTVLLSKSPVKILKDDKSDILKVGHSSVDIPIIDVDKLDDLNIKAEDKKPEDKIEGKTDDKKPEDSKTVSADLNVLRNTAKFLIEKGQWKDFEGSKEVLETLDEEGYADLTLQQNQAIIKEGVESELAKTGDYGKAIMEHIQNGGNPDDLIDIFKEQKTVEAIEIDTEAGQKQLIEKFYVDVYDWSPEKAKKYINTLISNDELESEAKEVDTKYKQFFQEEVKTRQLQAKEDLRIEQEKQKAFVQTINSKLTERKDFSEKEKKLIQDSIFRYDYTLPDGTKVNKFYQTFAEKQKNPDEYLDLVRFVMDKDGYNKSVKTKEDNKNVEKKWSFVKGNAAVDKTTGSRHEVPEDKSKTTNLNWSSVLNK